MTIAETMPPVLEGNFLSLDLETTGLDFRLDSIIEIGMVRMAQGNIEDTFEQLVNPEIPVPSTITQITGIKTADLADQPLIEQLLPEILEFIDDQWLIAHNASFDFDFLNQAIRKMSPRFPQLKPDRIIDTLILSRLLLPWLPNHRLSTIAESLGIQPRTEHRALSDAETAAHIFLELINRSCALQIEQIDIISQLLHASKDGLRLFFKAVESYIMKSGSREMPSVGMPVNIIGKVGQPASVNSDELSDIKTFFSKSGALAKHYNDYEQRIPQLKMAEAVMQTLNRQEILMAEAGTGVGKTMAYLYPAVIWSLANSNRQMVIATHTKTLQDQIFTREIPLLQSICPEFSAVLLKGRSNYLCLRRFMQLLTQSLERLSQSQRERLLPLIIWADLTVTGDIEENAGFHRESNRSLWGQVNCEPGHCQGNQCAFFGDCYLQSIRKASRFASLVVINHALLFSSLMQPRSIIGEVESLIIDEAHQIERIAAQHLGLVLSQGVFRDAVQWLYQSKPEEVGVLVVLKHYLEARYAELPNIREISTQIDMLIELTFTLLQEANHFFQNLNTFTDSRLRDNPGQSRIRLRQPSELHRALGIVFGQLLNVVRVLSENLQRLVTLLSPLRLEEESALENLDQEIATATDRLNLLENTVNHFQTADYQDHIVWIEKNIYQEHPDPVLHSVPLDIGKILANKLFSLTQRCILTSATLTVAEKFDYILNRLGLNLIDTDRIITGIFGSPFHYQDQALFLVPTFIPYPKADSYTYRVGQFIESILKIHERGTLILFTSHQMLKQVYEQIQPGLQSRGIRVLAQGVSGSRSSILKGFIEERRSVLLGTSSFWEGVDVPGNALEILVITRIPFDVPTEPLIEARMEEAEKRFGSGFFNYAVPEAVVRFRQGFGRLIRTASDRGVVLLLDQRAVKSKYGFLFLSSLPVEPMLCATEEEVMNKLENWF
jgi:predicted DnaQ family exonuclease/DinG family helicase